MAAVDACVNLWPGGVGVVVACISCYAICMAEPLSVVFQAAAMVKCEEQSS